MTQATKEVIRAAVCADPTLGRRERDEILHALLGRQPSAAKCYREDDAAALLGVSKSTVARMKRDGTLRTVKVRKQRRITAESVMAILG